MNVPRRFFVSEGELRSASAELSGDELHHALRVLRVEDGETVEAIDGLGRARTATVRRPSPARVVLELGADAPGREPSRFITLGISLLDSDAFDRVVRDGTQLGVGRIVPLAAERARPALAAAAPRKIDRWRRIAVEALKQCGRSKLPEIGGVSRLDDFLRATSGAILFDASGPRLTESDAAIATAAAIGPEGGWSEGELAFAAAAGVAVRSIGDRALRAETAALAALARLAL